MSKKKDPGKSDEFRYRTGVEKKTIGGTNTRKMGACLDGD